MKGPIMLDEKNAGTENLLSCVAHVLERAGFGMSGAIGGTFVAAYLARSNIEAFDSIGFIASMLLIGVFGFYLGIDIPRLRTSHEHLGPRHAVPQWDSVELLGATGTFLAAAAALISVYAIVFDEAPQRMWEFAIGCWWLVGVMMQIGAGTIGRLRLNSHTVVPAKRALASASRCEAKKDASLTAKTI
jgi:hypothetical protein